MLRCASVREYTPSRGPEQTYRVDLTDRQRQFLERLAARDSVEYRDVNTAMGWFDESSREEHDATVRPLVEDRLVTLTLSPSGPGWWAITDRGREEGIGQNCVRIK